MKIILFITMLFSGLFSQVDDILNDLQSTGIEEIKKTESVIQEVAPVVVKSVHMSESYYKLYLAMSILAAAVLFMWILLRHIGKTVNHTSDDIIAGAGLIIVVMGTLFIVIASTTTEALTAAIGLIGAVCGYVLGNLKKDRKEAKIE